MSSSSSSIDSNPIEKPGFGWTIGTSSSKEDKVVIINGKNYSSNDYNDKFPAKLINESINKILHEDSEQYLVDIDGFTENLYNNSNIVIKDYLKELNSCEGISNNRQLKWDIMKIKPNTSFKLHAHPNIEVIHCIKGAIHEYRFNGSPVVRDYASNEFGDNEVLNGAKFITRTCASVNGNDGVAYDDNIGDYLVNDTGSIHLSFTKSSGCILLVLWSGCHINIGVQPSSLPSLPADVMPYSLI